MKGSSTSTWACDERRVRALCLVRRGTCRSAIRNGHVARGTPGSRRSDAYPLGRRARGCDPARRARALSPRVCTRAPRKSTPRKDGCGVPDAAGHAVDEKARGDESVMGLPVAVSGATKQPGLYLKVDLLAGTSSPGSARLRALLI